MIATALDWLGFTKPARHRRTSTSHIFRGVIDRGVLTWLYTNGVAA